MVRSECAPWPEYAQGEELPADQRVGPWIPVKPVELVPMVAGGDSWASRRERSSRRNAFEMGPRLPPCAGKLR